MGISQYRLAKDTSVPARRINEIFIHGVTVSYHRGDGILLHYCYEDPRIADSLITYNKKSGVNLVGCHDIVVSSNQFEENLDGLDRVEVRQWKQGKLSGWALENVERRRCMKFYFSLLKGGFFESEQSRVRLSDGEDPYDSLVAKAASRAGK